MFLALSMMTEDIGKTEEKFLTDMYCRYYGLMKMYAIKVVQDENIAEDMVHEACIRLIGHAGKLQQMTEPVLLSYLRTTVRRVSLNYIARTDNKRMAAALRAGAELPVELEGSSEDIADEIVAQITAAEIAKCIKQLPQIYQDLLDFKYFLEMSDREIGETLGISKNSVRQYLTRARRKVFSIYEGGKENGRKH